MGDLREVAVLLNRGKADFIRRLAPGNTKPQDVCLLKWNVEFSVKGCAAIVPYNLLQEVADNNGGYLPGNLERYRKAGVVDERCLYCYAMRRNSGNVRPKVVNEKTRADFKSILPKIIRIGKLTEGGHPLYYKTMMDFLDLCREFGTSVIFTTKMLPFGIEGARQATQFAAEHNPT